MPRGFGCSRRHEHGNYERSKNLTVLQMSHQLWECSPAALLLLLSGTPPNRPSTTPWLSGTSHPAPALAP
ncbi:unnamed protein product [Closterium sp. NIES-65]|nr:unnamed protein product [Closterium sp. NIES-65]